MSEKKVKNVHRDAGLPRLFRLTAGFLLQFCGWAGWKRIRTLPDGDDRKGDTAAKMALNQGTSGFIVSMDHAFSDLNQLKGSGFHFHAYLITPFIP